MSLRDQAMLAALQAHINQALERDAIPRYREIVAQSWAVADEVMLQRARLDDEDEATPVSSPMRIARVASAGCVDGRTCHSWDQAQANCRECGAAPSPVALYRMRKRWRQR